MIVDGSKVSVYFGESVEVGSALASDALMGCVMDHGIRLAVLFRGFEGFGLNRRIHAERFPDISTDLPLVLTAVDSPERIRDALDAIDKTMPRGLVTLERVRLATGSDVDGAEFPEGPGKAAQLTIYCRAGEKLRGRLAYREAVVTLRRHGASGAIVLPGVDGIVTGRRGKARLFVANRNTPMVIISIGAPEMLQRCLPRLRELFTEPTVTLERLAAVKHDGELLEAPPTVTRTANWARDMRQAVQVFTRQAAKVDGQALHAALTLRLRELGAAGATTILGDWGFSSDESPHGDKVGTVASHRPTYTVYIDRPENVAKLWPVIDELTASHGVVTSLLVPGYRERASDSMEGILELPEDIATLWRLQEQQEGDLGSSPVDGGPEPSDWPSAFLARAEQFARKRGRQEPIVRATLADGESFFVYAIEPGPSEGFLTLYPHPERYDEFVQGANGLSLPPRAVIVPCRSIIKLELLTRPPRGTRSLVTLRQSP
jgi:PII-like signaling protein